MTRSYLAVLETLMDGRVVRPRHNRHPRLAILGPLEMRLQHFDLLILAGLNEGDTVVSAGAYGLAKLQVAKVKVLGTDKSKD